MDLTRRNNNPLYDHLERGAINYVTGRAGEFVGNHAGGLYDYAAGHFARAQARAREFQGNPQLLANEAAANNRGGPGRSFAVRGGKALGKGLATAAIKAAKGGKKSKSTSAPTAAPVHRRIEPVENSLQSAQMPGGNNMEVAVIPPPRKIVKITNDHFTVNLPFVTRTWSSAEAAFTFDVTDPFAVIRLNSIYDPIKKTHATKLATFNTDVQPHGRHIWDTHFQFYRVLKTHVKLTFVNNRVLHHLKDDRPFNEHYVVGYELVDESQQISNHVDMFLMTKRAKREILGPAGFGITFKSGAVLPAEEGDVVNQYPQKVATKVMTYTYVPEAWNTHVEEKGQEERWTPIGANPSIDHDMVIRIMHLDKALPEATAKAIGVLIQVSYDVQFRESVDSFTKTLNNDTGTYPDAEAEADD